MADTWDEARLQQYIDDEIQENLSLEYKRANALNPKNPKWLDELTKDVSAMANSAGGILIYGIAEKDDTPVALDPVDKTQFTRERLDQVLASNIKPRIEGLTIYPVPISSHADHVAYVLDIPQSNTAHQANDKRYHKRLNTTTAWIEDYEIRDVMGRGQHPKIKLEFQFAHIEAPSLQSLDLEATDFYGYLRVTAINIGAVMAKYINVYFFVPNLLLQLPNQPIDEAPNWQDYYRLGFDKGFKSIYRENTTQDYLGLNSEGRVQQGPVRYIPILPGRSFTWNILMRRDFETVPFQNMTIKWDIYVDDTGKSEGEVKLGDLKIVEGYYEDFI